MPDQIEREAIRAEGLDPDGPAVVTAIDLVHARRHCWRRDATVAAKFAAIYARRLSLSEDKGVCTTKQCRPVGGTNTTRS
jgi:hypothetical protein